MMGGSRSRLPESRRSKSRLLRRAAHNRPVIGLAALFTVGLILVGLVFSPLNTRTITTPAPTLGISPGSSLFSISDRQLNTDLQRAAELGLRWIRLDIDWSRIEDEPGEFDWESTDRLVEAAIEADLKVLGLLTYSPSWATAAGSTDKAPPLDPKDFANFAATAVARYEPVGVATWEIWNEPNSISFWETGVDPARYAELLLTTSHAIRTVDPNATILSGGLAPATDDLPLELSPEAFIGPVLDALARNSASNQDNVSDGYPDSSPGSVAAVIDGVAAIIDGVAIHPYSYPALPTDRPSWNTFRRLPEFHDLVEDHAGVDLPLWLTEFGAPTGDAPKAVSPERQEEIIVQAMSCASEWPWVEMLFLYNLRDTEHGDLTDPEDNFGILTESGESKPVALVLTEDITRRWTPWPSFCG